MGIKINGFCFLIHLNRLLTNTCFSYVQKFQYFKNSLCGESAVTLLMPEGSAENHMAGQKLVLEDKHDDKCYLRNKHFSLYKM